MTAFTDEIYATSSNTWSSEPGKKHPQQQIEHYVRGDILREVLTTLETPGSDLQPLIKKIRRLV